MQIFKKAPHFDFMAKRKLAIVFSLLLLAASIGSLAVRGLNFGLDFTGGTLIEVGYAESVDLQQVRSALDKAGLGDAVVQHFGTTKDVLVRLAPGEGEESEALGDQILQALNTASDSEVEMRRQ